MTAPTRVTIERELDDAGVAAWWPVYEAAFTPLATRAAARHLLSPDEFAEEMTDPRIMKLLAWDVDGNAVAMTTIATDLDAVAWISPNFYRSRYSDAHDRGALWYVGYTLAHPTVRGTSAFADMIDVMFDLLTSNGVTVGYDVSRFNDLSLKFAEHMVGRARLVAEVDSAEVDVQTYYTATFAAKR